MKPKRLDAPYRLENFQVYRAKKVERTFLVAGTSILPPGGDRLSRPEDFEPTTAQELAQELWTAYEGSPIPVTIRVHGYNTRRKHFERAVLEDAAPALFGPKNGGADHTRESFRPDGAFYVGYWWQSEGLLSGTSFRDTIQAIGLSPAVGWVLLILPILGFLTMGGCLAKVAPFLANPPEGSFFDLVFLPFLRRTSAAMLLGAGVLVVLLRVSTYLRDRYRALHYGVPDFGEFIRALEGHLRTARRAGASSAAGTSPGPVAVLNVIGHSMGTLVLINAFRVMVDYFSTESEDGSRPRSLGPQGTLGLGSMILCAADIPAIMATPDHDNYFLSALRRFDLHVLSSDRDVILKWLSLIANWAIEPRHDMAGRKLGNTLLIRMRPPWQPEDAGETRGIWPVTRPVWRPFPLYRRDPLQATSTNPEVYPVEREKLFFYDCTLDPSVSGSMPALLGALLIVIVLVAAITALPYGVVWLVNTVRPEWQWGWHWPAPAVWLVGAYGALVVVGLLCRGFWPWARDRGALGGILGMFIDWPTTLVFLMGHRGWNPHGGYFAFGRPPRQLIANLLRGQVPALEPQPTIRQQEVEVCV